MKNIFISIYFVFQVITLSAQEQLVFKDNDGRLKWTKDKTEAFFWGVNYSAAFAHGYRQILRNGAEHKRVIEKDAYHLSRMGVNAFRIHIWDCEISDVTGNLLNNEHLNLLDYTIHQFQQRGIHVILTGMAYWGNGYPEVNDPNAPGFSTKYSKRELFIDPVAIAAQERYLKQLVTHVNPYTGKSYKDDPMIIAVEINNEPGNSGDKETTNFVKKMVTAVRSTGFKKPVFYNATHPIGLLESYVKGGADGHTFQWYPSGLVFNRERPGTFLPHVDIYDMPFKDEKYFAKQARIVYEFDAADIGRSYLYPPMAISWKEAGMQWVTMFAYDPEPIASANTEYQTHFLSLIYSPQKALGFKIAGELFRNPQFKRDRVNEKSPFEMNDVIIGYEKDLSVLATDQSFFYTNNTDAQPKNPATLQFIAGYGSSPVVSYNGRGAYFLDKISDGTWRLEVYPDAIWVRDPFSRATPHIENVMIRYNEYPMTVLLPGLGSSFFVTGVNDGNRYTTTAANGQFNITPGAYILSVKPFDENLRQTKISRISANEFNSPKENKENEQFFLHEPQKMIIEGQPVHVNVEIVSPKQVKQLTLQMSGGFRGGFRPVSIPMDKKDGYKYSAIINDTLVRAGTLNYVVRVEYLSGKEMIYPGAVEGPANRWDYYNPESYSVLVLPEKTGIELYSAETGELPIVWSFGVQLQTNRSAITGETTASIEPVTAPARQGFTPTRDDRAQAVFAMECFVKPQIDAIRKYANQFTQLKINAKSEKEPVTVEITLISKSGGMYSGKTTITSNSTLQSISLKDFIPGKMMLLPRPFPGFQPFWYSNPNQQAFNLNDIERIQLVIPVEGNDENPSFEIKSIYIE